MQQKQLRTPRFMMDGSLRISQIPLVLSLACLGVSIPLRAQGFANEGTRTLPVIEAQPYGQVVTVGHKATFSVKAKGVAVTYQWFKNGTLIFGAVSSSYTTPNARLVDGGSQYTVRVRSLTGAVWSEAAVLTVKPSIVAPSIVSQPVNQTVNEGQSATFKVAATGTNPLNYQWLKDGQSISGATSASYSLTQVGLADSGVYTVTVSNGAGSVVSNPAQLVVNPLPAIASFKAEPSKIKRGESCLLTAAFSHGVGVIQPGNIPVSSGIPLTLQPSHTTIYTLEVHNQFGDVLAKTLQVEVERDIFIASGNMSVGRWQHTATVLSNGKVLIAGGRKSGPTAGGTYANEQGDMYASAELYDPSTGTFSSTGSMLEPRRGHTATLLPNGNVLVAGGHSRGAKTSAEIYDSNSGLFTPTGEMHSRVSSHTATLLPNGNVLIAGGYSNDKTADEIYDFKKGTFTKTSAMIMNRYYHTATLLSNGKVLLIGGYSHDIRGILTPELYDYRTNEFTLASSMNVDRFFTTATLLHDGKVLVTGGERVENNIMHGEASTEIYNPESNTFSVTASVSHPWNGRTATLLPSGKVVITGGLYAEIYHPENGSFTTAGSNAKKRSCHQAVLLKDGRLLLIGGIINDVPDASTETYSPDAQWVNN